MAEAQGRAEPATGRVPAAVADPAALRRERRRLAFLLVPIGAFFVLGIVANVVVPAIVNERPALALAIDARNRYLLITIGAGIDALPYFVFAFLRLTVADPLFYLLGRWYGERGLAWVERQAGPLGYVRWIERVFNRARVPLVALMPNQIVCFLAGMGGMAPRVFVPANLLGTVGRLVFFWYAAKPFKAELESVADFVQRYQWWIVIGFLALAMVQGGRNAARSGPPKTLHEVEDEILGVDGGEPPTGASPRTER